jgi:hypothetical protein
MTPSVRTTLCLVVLGVLPLAACAAGGHTSSGASAAPGTVPSPSSTIYPTHVVGPSGIGPLHLGMTIQQAQATHLFGQLNVPSTACAEASNQDLTIKYSVKYGVTLIGAERGRTPEGIGLGSTFAEVKHTYPRSAEPELGTLDEQLAMFGEVEAQVPGNPAADYTIVFDRPGHHRVLYVFLKLKAEQDC